MSEVDDNPDQELARYYATPTVTVEHKCDSCGRPTNWAGMCRRCTDEDDRIYAEDRW